MPEVKRFFYDSVLQGEYGDKLTVQFIPGATPELILFGPDDEELSREVVENLGFDQLHAFVQSKGFQRIKQVEQTDEHQEQEAEEQEAEEQLDEEEESAYDESDAVYDLDLSALPDESADESADDSQQAEEHQEL